jgi:ABC-type glycerol-3-phosphate transport system permease component
MASKLPVRDADQRSGTPSRIAPNAPAPRRWRDDVVRTLVLAVRSRLFWFPLMVLFLWTVAPLVIALSVSLKEPAEVFSNPQLIPPDPTFDAYTRTLARRGFRITFLNSVLVATGTVALTFLLGVPAAYAFARFKFRGRHALLLLMLLPRLVPTLGLMVPLYQLAASLGALDSRLTLIVAYTGTMLPLAVWLMVGFFQQIPIDLEEAAAVDGASLFQRLRLVVLPLVIPALITIGILTFREAWNEFDLVLVLVTSPDKRTLPYELYLLSSNLGVPDFPIESAFALLTVLPLILAYLRLEKYVVGGITSGSVK